MRPQIMNRCHVQIGGRFVQQIDLRIHRIDGSKGNFLLLPAGESKDIAAQQVFDTECLGCFHHTLSHLFLRHSLVFHVFLDTTLKNIAASNGKIAISVYDAQNLEGYQIKGAAQYVTEGEVVRTFKAMVEKMFNGAATAKGALIITPEKVIVTTPGADNKKEL